jgi:hypothetical protein
MDLFGLKKAKKSDDSMELLVTTHDNIELSILKSILEGEGIPYMVHDRGTGSAMRIIAGYSMFGTDIYVPKNVVESAKALLEAYRNAETVEDDSVAPVDDADEEA